MKELKALEILKKAEWHIASHLIRKEQIKEAIKELEELDSRSCDWCNNNIFNKGKKEYGCNRIEINPSDMKQVGFYCSRYEAKGE